MPYNPLADEPQVQTGVSAGRYNPLADEPTRQEEPKRPKPPSAYDTFKGSYVGKQLADVGSAGTAVADIAGGVLGYVGGAVGTAAGELNRVQLGNRAIPAKGVPNAMQDIERGAEEGAQKLLLSNLAPGEKEGLGYKAVMHMMAPIAKALELPGKGIEALAQHGMLGSERTQPGQVAELKAGANVGVFGASMALPIGLPKPKPGSMAWYNQLSKQATKAQDVSGAAYARSTYPKPVPDVPEAPQPLYKYLQQPPHPAFAPELQPAPGVGPEPEFEGGGPGKRDVPAREIASPITPDKAGALDLETLQQNQLRQLTDQDRGQPRTAPDDIPYRRYDPSDVNQLTEAENTPGFLRTAEQRIALRFDHIRNMEETNAAGQAKLNLEATNAKGEAEDVSKAIDPIPVPKEVQLKAEDIVSRDVNARFTEYLPTGQVWLLRDHNRLTDPKSDHQFAGKEASVLKNGINMPLELKYSTADGKAVLTNGNTRTSLAMKHGLPEIPVRVTVVKEPLKGTEATNGVDVGKHDVKPGPAKPSDIGLKGRLPQGNTGKIGRQSGAIGLDIRRKYQQNLDELHDKVNRGEELSPKEEENRRNLFRSLNGAPPTAGFKGFGQRGAIGSDLDNSGPKNPKDIIEAVRRFGNTEERPLSEAAKDVSRESIKDLDGPDHANLFLDMLSNAKQLGRNALGADTIRSLAEKTGSEKIVRWVNQAMINVDMFERQVTKDILLGVKYARGRIDKLLGPFGRGFEHRENSDGLIPSLRSIPKGESKSFLDKWFGGEGKEGDIAFDTPLHKQVYDKIQAGLAKLHNWMNEERQKLGMDKIAWLPNFYPHVREAGDYIVNVYDKVTQQHLRYAMFQTMGQAKKAEATLRAQLPDMDVRPAVHKQVKGAMGTDLDAILETARVNAFDSDVTKAIDRLIDQVVSKRGAGGHLMQRATENIGGWLGENRSMPEVEKALTLYTNNAVTYIANLKRRGIQKQVNDLRFPTPDDAKPVYRDNRATGGRYPDEPNRLLDIAPRLHSYLDQYISQSRGNLQALDKLDKAFMEELGKGLQIGATGGMRAIYKLNNIATVGYLSKTPFFVSQFFQPLLAIPRMMKLQNELGGSGGLVPATFDFLMGYMHAIMPGLDSTGHSQGVVNYAIKRGMIDPTISHMLESSTSYGPVSTTFYKFTGALEREVVRIPALLMIENSLRNVIKDPAQRYEVSTAQMYRSMSGTTRSNTPLLYTKMGPIGASAKTMKSYATNYYGQITEYMHDVAVADTTGEKLKALRPLGAFIGTTALFGGINGVVGFQEADAAITLFNTLTTSNVRTPREWVMTSGMSDSLVQSGMSPERARDINDIAAMGLASKMMPGQGGRDIQAQVGNPPTTSILSIVPYKVPIDVAVGLIPYIVAVAEGKLTDATRMSTYEHLTLNNPHLRTQIEAHFQQPGQPVPRPYMDSAGNFYRDNIEYWKTGLMGMNTLDERRADLALQFFRRHESRLEKDRTEFLHSFVDDMMKEQERIDDLNWRSQSDKLQQYFAQGGNADSLKQDLTNTIIRRHLTGMQYEQYKGAQHGGPGYVKKLQEIQPYNQMLPQSKGRYNPLADE